MKRLSAELLLALLFATPNLLLSQEFRGAISGVITDPTGAMVTGARVMVTEVNTGTRMERLVPSGLMIRSPALVGKFPPNLALQQPGLARRFARTAASWNQLTTSRAKGRRLKDGPVTPNEGSPALRGCTTVLCSMPSIG